MVSSMNMNKNGIGNNMNDNINGIQNKMNLRTMKKSTLITNALELCFLTQYQWREAIELDNWQLA